MYDLADAVYFQDILLIGALASFKRCFAYIVITDVREPDEVILGSIPSSVNVPLSNFEKAFDLDGADFLRAYGFRKPDKKQSMIFYCKTGKRSSTAMALAKGKGFPNVRNYTGSWADVSQ